MEQKGILPFREYLGGNNILLFKSKIGRAHV